MIEGYQVGINFLTANSDNGLEFLGPDSIPLTNMCITKFIRSRKFQSRSEFIIHNCMHCNN